MFFGDEGDSYGDMHTVKDVHSVKSLLGAATDDTWSDEEVRSVTCKRHRIIFWARWRLEEYRCIDQMA